MGWLESLALAAFVAGLTGGVHCAAMCGGIVCMLTQDGKASGGRRWQFALAYNAG